VGWIIDWGFYYVTRLLLRQYDRVSHVRIELHWLPVHARIEFKILNMTWKAINKESPQYIADLLNESSSTINLRNNHQNLLEVPL
jgi:hypothetical protein